jgi:nucleoid-associated protein YgaU
MLSPLHQKAVRPRAVGVAAGSDPGWRRSLRAVGVGAVGVLAATLLWRLRPPASLPTQPDTDIVTGCGWLAGGLASYLSLSVAGAAIAVLLRWRGPARFAPATVRRLVDSAVSMGLVAAIVAPTAAVATPARHTTVAASTVAPRAPALDWPGLTVALPPSTRPAPRHAAALREVVVRPGDTLWSIAAAYLGPGASREQIAASWPRWYAANRHLIGADPGVIQPGERLRPPAF